MTPNKSNEKQGSVGKFTLERGGAPYHTLHLLNNGEIIAEFQDETHSALIASAPELLEMLKDLVYAKETGMGSSAVNLRYDLARQAIAKAEGCQ